MLTVTYISAYKPPIAVFILGGESGLQCALLGSYDWRDDTFEREIGLHVCTTMLDQMRRMSQFRLRLSSSHFNHRSPPADEEDMKNRLAGVVMALDGVSRWKMGLLFASVAFVRLSPLSLSFQLLTELGQSESCENLCCFACRAVDFWIFLRR